jgi:uncharacterized protein YbjT (DUF2867 family)
MYPIWSQVVARLRAEGLPVRMLTREAAHAADIDGEFAVGDVRDEASLKRAVAGCTTVVSAFHGFLGGRSAGPLEIDLLGNRALARAAMQAGVQHLVLVSVYDARADHLLELHRAKHAAEQAIPAAGPDWTILRPTAYVETWLPIVAGGVSKGKPPLVLGAGANVKAVQTMLGHKSAAMTLDTHADLFPDDLDDVASALDRAVTRSRTTVRMPIRSARPAAQRSSPDLCR